MSPRNSYGVAGSPVVPITDDRPVLPCLTVGVAALRDRPEYLHATSPAKPTQHRSAV